MLNIQKISINLYNLILTESSDDMTRLHIIGMSLLQNILKTYIQIQGLESQR